MQIQNGHGGIVEVPDVLHVAAAEEFLNSIGAFLAAEAAAKAVTPGYLSFDEPGPGKMGLLILFGDMNKGVDLARKAPAVVDYRTPDGPGLPPSIVGLVGPEGEQEGNDGAHDHRDR